MMEYARFCICLRTQAGAVLLAVLLGLALWPSAGSAAAVDGPLVDTSEARFARTLIDIQDSLAALNAQLEQGRDAGIERSELLILRTELAQLDRLVSANFADLGAQLEQARLPAVILARHDAMQAHYREAIATLLADLDAIAQARDTVALEVEVIEARARLEAVQPVLEPELDPDELAFALDEDAIAGTPARSPQLVTGAPTALAASADSPLTPAIRALAQRLEHNPVKIYNWVHDHIAFAPSYGALQGAAQTLASRRGNAFDTASLLIALLSAADIPAHYVLGTVRMPIAVLQNALGNVSTPEAALSLLTQGGIPFATVTERGRIAEARLDHVWVQAWVDFEPSRGARHRTGDSWIPLDASFKHYDYRTGAPAAPAAGSALALALAASADYDLAEGWVRRLDDTLVDAALADYRNVLSLQVGANASVADVLGDAGVIAPAERPVLAASLPYRHSEIIETLRDLPTVLQHRLGLTLYPSRIAQRRGDAAIALELALPAIAGQQLALRFVPTSPADAEVLASFLPQPPLDLGRLPASLPGYLIEVNAEVTLGGDVIAGAGPFTLGQALALELNHITPTQGQRVRSLYPVAGEYHALGWDLQGGLGAALRAADERLANLDVRLNIGANADDLVGPVLHAGLTGYFAANDAYNAWQANAGDAVVFRAPSFGSLRTVLETEFLFGLPRNVHLAGVGLSVPQLRVQAAGRTQIAPATRLIRQLGQLGSSLAHTVLEGLFLGTEPGISALRVFSAALAANHAVYSMSAAPTLDLQALDLSQAQRETINAATAAGLRVTFNSEPVTIGAWQGIGVAAVDPEQGHGDYRVLGSSGSETQGLGLRYGEAGKLWFWLGLNADVDVQDLYPLARTQLAAPKALIGGFIPIVEQPFDVPLSETVATLIAATRLDLAAYSELPAVVSDHLFASLLNDRIGLSQVLDPQPPQVQLSLSAATLSLGESVTITASAVDNQGIAAFEVSINGVALNLNSDGQALFTPDFGGVYTVLAIARDAAGNLSQREAIFTVVDPADNDAPVARLISPADLAVVTAPVDVIGRVEDANLASWQLLIASGEDRKASVLAEGSAPFSEQVIARFDPTLLHNGIYILSLRAVDASGLESFDSLALFVEGGLKVGHFALTFADFTVPVAGIPVTITRTYDTRQRAEPLDFGFGWSVGYQNIRVFESGRAGFAWETTEEGGGFFPERCVRSNGDRVVAIRLPDGELEKFVAKASPECRNALDAFTDVSLVYKPLPGTHSTLEQLDYGLLRVLDGHLVDIAEPDTPVDPKHYKLGTVEGFVYFLDQGFTVQRIIDPNGNEITFSKTGIRHSAGLKVDFIRDNEGRISEVQLPDGERLHYRYDPSGNLSEFVDQLGHTTRFVYQPGHYLADIVDPRGVRVARNVYDNEGRLIAHIDADGQRIDYAHDIAGRTETIKDRRGFSTVYVYDERGNVLAETNALGETITHSYDDDDNELTRTDALGHTTTWTYDGRGNELSETNPLGQTTTFTYDTRDQLLTETAPDGTVVLANSYDGRGNLIATADGLGQTSRFGYYTQDGTLGSVTDALGNVTRFEAINRFGLPKREVDAGGVVTSYEYDSLGNRLSGTTTRTDAGGQSRTLTARYEYDAKSRVVATTDALGQTTRTVYNELDQAVAAIDGLGRRTEYQYDSRGNRTLIRYPDGKTERTEYDAEDNIVAETDRAGRTTRFEYDAAKRLVATTYPGGSDTTQAYDAAGRPTAVTDERGHQTRYTFDAAGRRTRMTDALGQVTAFSYDAQGRRAATTDALGRTTRFRFDAAGRLVATTYPDGTASTTVFDAIGRKIATTDQAGKTTRFEYDAGSNLTAVVDAFGGRTVYGYDEQSNKLTQTDAEGRVTRWSYDDGGRVISSTLPLGQTETLAYDAVGNQIRKTDFNGQTITYGYDSLDREIRRDYPDGTVVVTAYTAAGQVDTVTDNRGVTDYSYDALDRLVAISYPNGNTIAYQYDAAGNRTRLTAVGRTVDYKFDALNRLSAVTDPNGTTTYAYDALGNQTAIDYANGTRSTYLYDALNRVTEIEHFDATSALIGFHRYTLGPSGQRIRLDELGDRVVAYDYDALDRLIEERVSDPALGDRVAAWTYDAVGNRLIQDENGEITTYDYDANDRLLSATVAGETTTYAYDDNGNTLGRSGPDGTTAYGYDAENRLVEATVAAGTVEYAYDAAGIRQSQIVNGVATEFLVDPNRAYSQVVAEFNAGDLPRTHYTYGDDLLSQERNEGAFFYHYDGVGSTRLLTDSEGSSTDGYIYRPFGETDSQSGNTPNAYLFDGEQIDPNLGLYYFRARYMDPAVGRFVSTDPFSGVLDDPLSLHKYQFAHLAPVNFADPSGLVTLGNVTTAVNVAGNLQTVATIGVNLLTGNYTVAAGQIAEEVVYSKLGVLGRPISQLSDRGLRLFYRIFGRNVNLDLGKLASGTILERNLAAIGVSKPGGSVQAHHLVAGTSARAQAARNVLNKHSIDINSPLNGVFLPGCNSTNAIGTIHCGPHRRSYIEDVNRRLIRADAVGGKTAVLNALGEIKVELLAGLLELNRRGVK